MLLFFWDFSRGYASLCASPVASTCNKGKSRWSAVVACSDIETLAFHGAFFNALLHIWFRSVLRLRFLLLFSVLNLYCYNVTLRPPYHNLLTPAKLLTCNICLKKTVAQTKGVHYFSVYTLLLIFIYFF